MIYLEQATMAGSWCPVLFVDRPLVVKSPHGDRLWNGCGPRVRGMVEIDDCHAQAWRIGEMNLESLRMIYSSGAGQ